MPITIDPQPSTTTPFPVVVAPTTPQPAGYAPRVLGSFGNPSIDQWDTAFLAASRAVWEKKGVSLDPHILKAMMQIESGGDGDYPAKRCRTGDAYDHVPACGPMQIKRAYHQQRCPECDFTTVAGQIELAAHILADTMKATGHDAYAAIRDVYFPGSDGATTQAQYLAKARSLVAQMAHPVTGGTATTPAPAPVDLCTAIVGGAHYTDAYGFKSPTSLPYYAYFVGHGGSSNQHTGIDVTGAIGEPLFSPISGTVVCAGTGVGPGAYGSSCAAFANEMGQGSGSSGRFEILADDGKRSLILGHVLRSLAEVGSRVKPGQHVADMGGAGMPPGPHCHVEARTWVDGMYTIRDPRQVFSKVSVGTFVERVPYNFDPNAEPAPNLFTVKARVPLFIYQRADPNAAILDTLAEGEEFQAVAIIPGNDGRRWWLGVHNGRIPTDGTSIIKGG